MVKKINVNAIRIDGGTQSRVEIDNQVVADYAEAIKAGIEFPPVVVFHDGADHWLADGFHRFHAHKQADKASIPAEVRDGTVRDAILYSVGANGTHGLRRTNADKRKAVETMLADAVWALWTDRKIAEACGVGHPFVAAVRRPAVAEKQQERRVQSTFKKAGKVESDSTYNQQQVESDSTTAPKPAPWDAAAPKPEDLAEAREAVHILAEENERLSDRLAVEAMDASEEEKTQAQETLASLRAQVKTLSAELSAVKASRDEYMRENAELKRQVAGQRKQLDKLKTAA